MQAEYELELTERMLNFDYLTEVTVEDIRDANKKSNGGGVPLFAIKEIRDKVRKFWKN